MGLIGIDFTIDAITIDIFYNGLFSSDDISIESDSTAVCRVPPPNNTESLYRYDLCIGGI